MTDYSPIYLPETDVYRMDGFRPPLVDAAYLGRLGVKAQPSPAMLEGLEQGSRIFARRLEERKLLPRTRFELIDIEPAEVVPVIHNYTGRCPTLTYEINPVRGCGVGCQYCLVTDGVHEQPLTAVRNYHLYVRRLLEEKNGAGSENRNHYYYFSPKTEAFQEATLLTGIAHRILREFIDHFRRHPGSRARLFIASKAGARHLEVADGGETVLDLFARLKDRMQFNTSVSIMPKPFRADSALVQPIFTPYLTEEHIRSFFDALHREGIVNYKPEFLTACMENLAMLGPLLGLTDPRMERQLYEDYLLPSNEDHRKQRARTAPDRRLSLEGIRRMMAYTDTLGMSVSICYWVRRQLDIPESLIPLVNRNGFQCLGYQSKLFGHV